MALSVALPLSGLETKGFSSFHSFGLRDILGSEQCSPSPSSSSESSGIGSLKSEQLETITELSTPEKIIVKPQVNKVKVMYRGRNILDFTTNIRAPHNEFRYTHLPSHSMTTLLENRSQYHRLRYEQPQHPTRICGGCGFVVPI